MEFRIVDFEILSSHYIKYKEGLGVLDFIRSEYLTKLEPIKKEMNTIIASMQSGVVVNAKTQQENSERFQLLQEELVSIDKDATQKLTNYRDKMTKEVYGEMEVIITEWSKSHNIDLVMGKIECVYVTEEFEVTDYILEVFKSKGSTIACVIVEPVAGNMNLLPASLEFLQTMRRLCTQHGALLLFDEVMSGFRVALGGAQSIYGVTPDMTVLGKVIGGGLPVAAFGGRADLMQHLAPIGGVYQAGTLSGNPVAVAAGMATLEIIQQPGFYESLTKQTKKLTDGLSTVAKEVGIDFCANAVGGMFGIYFTHTVPTNYAEMMQCDKNHFNTFFHLMLDRGVYLAPSAFEAGFVSAQHDDAIINETLRCAREAFTQVAA